MQAPRHWLEHAENVTIWVTWPPNLASFAAAFCILRTHARQGPNLGPLNLGLRTGSPFWTLMTLSSRFPPSFCLFMSLSSSDPMDQTYIMYFIAV
jgi:hypothetical protein